MPDASLVVPRGRPTRAAQHATQSDTPSITIEGFGTFQLPKRSDLAFVGGIAVLAAVGVMEWPVAAVLGIGHLLSRGTQNQTLREFGAALEEA